MTPHNEANKSDIAKVVLMPGDPLRARFIAEKYLKNYRLVNTVRNMYAYTGYYKNKRITVMASGMGMPSMGIYSYELFKFYNVDEIIRIGSAGSYIKDLKLYDLVLVKGSYTESTYAQTQNNCTNKILYSNEELNNHILEVAQKKKINIHYDIVHCSDVFYQEDNHYETLYQKYNCTCVEMESFALFHNANLFNKKASCILTISDNLVTKRETTSAERQNSFKEMIELALDSIE